MATLDQLLAETLPTPPSTLDAGKMFFDNLDGFPINGKSSSRSRLSTASGLDALYNDIEAAHQQNVTAEANDTHVVPDITATVTTDSHHGSSSSGSSAPMPDLSQLADPPSRRELRKRRARPDFRGLDTSDDDEAADPAFKRAKQPASKDDEEDASSEFSVGSSRSSRSHHRAASPSNTSAIVTQRIEATVTIRPQRSPSHQQQQHHDSDDEFSHEHIMSPAEEADLRRLLEIRQRELDQCGQQMKGMTPAQKKRLRNKHASCVSRLKKKLYICNLLRELERAREQASTAETALAAAEEDRSVLRNENAALKARLAGDQPATAPRSYTADSRPGLDDAQREAEELATTSSSTNNDAKLQQVDGAAGLVMAPPAGSSLPHCLCQGSATTRMRECDSCHRWFHLECVGLNTETANRAWHCPTCN